MLPRYRYPIAAAVCALLVLAETAGAQTIQTNQGTLRAAGPVRPVKRGEDVYIVELRDAATVNYEGGKAGYSATKPTRGTKLDRDAGNVASYAKMLERSHDSMLDSVGARDRKIHSYSYALNGFAARLTGAEVAALARRRDVENIWLDTEQRVQTNNSAVFLGLLDQDGGLRADRDLRGEGVVVGVIDSGVAASHPALSDSEAQIPRACESEWARSSWLGRWLCDDFFDDPPTEQQYGPLESFNGACEEGEGFGADQCNNKLVGARYYIDGFLSRNDLDAGEFISPKDADGHGTHIATTVAGNRVTARLFGTRIGEISGIAPRARVAAYKACWLKPGDTRASCATSDLARAIDDAVADGVDIINYSVGSLETDLTAPDDLALLNALDAGVLSVVAAGNDGPTRGTIGSPSSAPWVLTVGASTQTGNRFEEAVKITAPEDLAGRIAMREASFTEPLSESSAVAERVVLVDDGTEPLGGGGTGTVRDACQALENAGELDGRIALIERGGCEFQTKLERVESTGAIGAIVYNDNGLPFVMNGDAGSVSIPAVMIGTADGQRLVDRLADDAEVEVTLEKGIFLERRDTGNRMSEFSSRGPSASEPDFIKPDVTAPGVNILAGNSPDVANGRRGELYQYLSGTSQSAPEAAGIAALLKEAHPDFSPGALKSALMTTAYTDVTQYDGEAPAAPFDRGAGHVDANRAIDPGLVYDAGYLDHAAYLCGLEQPPYPASDCAILAEDGYLFSSRDLNVPSIGIDEYITGDLISRVVTNVGPPATYEAFASFPEGVEVLVEPPTLNLDRGESTEIDIGFVGGGVERETWHFGHLRWSDGERDVVSPIAIRPVTMRAPDEMFLSDTSGTETVPVDFGYAGEYAPDVHGLNAPFLLERDVFVEDDPTNDFSFRSDNGVVAHTIDVAPGDVFLRVSLFDANTDGNDDLDLYLFYCPTLDNCRQVAQSGSFTSEEEINLELPAPGLYTILVHGFETDQASGGPGAFYDLFAWKFGADDDAGNFSIEYTPTVENGDRWDFELDWSGLAADTRYLGAISHNTPFDGPSGFYDLTLLNVDTR